MRRGWQKGKKRGKAWNSGLTMSDEFRKKLSNAKLGKRLSPETKRKMSQSAKTAGTGKWMLGRKLSKETKDKISKANKGENSYNWKGGISKNKDYRSWLKNKRNRNLRAISGNHSWEEWIQLKIDYKFTCPSCKMSEPKIQLTADHIIPVSMNGSNDINNIQPLCRSCNSRKSNKIIPKYHLCSPNPK